MEIPTIPTTIHLTPNETEYVEKHFPNLPQSITEWSRRFFCTAEDIENMANCDQGTPEWLRHREWRLTGSLYGTAAGENPYPGQKPIDLVRDWLWPTEMDAQGKANCKWGNDHEDDACDAYEEYMRYQKGLAGDSTPFWVDHFGLEVHPKEPWTGDSKDGVVNNVLPDGSIQKWLLEIKCPPLNRFTKKYKLYPNIPAQYYAQIQGIMGYNNLPFCDLVIWNPEAMIIERYQFDQKYFDWLLAEMRAWYMLQFAPRAILKEAGLLQEGEIDVETRMEHATHAIEYDSSTFASIESFFQKNPVHSTEPKPKKAKAEKEGGKMRISDMEGFSFGNQQSNN